MRLVHCVVSAALTMIRVAAPHRDMKEIIKTMTHLQDKPVWRRFLRKDKHSDALAKHHQGLTHALVMFQVGFFLFMVSIYLCQRNSISTGEGARCDQACATQRPPTDGCHPAGAPDCRGYVLIYSAYLTPPFFFSTMT